MHALRPPGPLAGASARTAAWVLLLCVLVAFTLDNTHPYQGDETYYIRSAIGMVKSGDLLVPGYEGVIRLQKPILAYWLTAAGYEAFGISLWAGRVPFLLAAAALLLAVYRLARLLGHDGEAAGLSVVLLSSSILFLLFTRVSMTDLPLTLCSTAALYFLCRAHLVAGSERRDLTCAWLSMGAGFLAKGPLALMPAAAVAAWLISTQRTAAWPRLRAMCAPRHIAVFGLVALPWYGYILLAHPEQWQAQFTRESADNLWPGVPGLVWHALYYAGALVMFQIPAVALTAWAWRTRPATARAFCIGPLVWYVAIGLAVPTLLFAHNRDRYLLPVLPVFAVMMAQAIDVRGKASRARRLAAAATVLQVAGIWMHGYVVGRPWHDLVGCWDQQLRGDLAVHALKAREATWVLAIAGGRVVPRGASSPYVLTPAAEAERMPGYEVVRRAARRSSIARTHGRLTVQEREYVLLGLRSRPAGPG